MRFKQYYSYAADGTKLTASESAYSDRFASRSTAIFYEEEVWNTATQTWDIEITKVVD